MNMFQHLRDLVLGRIKHWNETNNAVIRELWSRGENLEKPFDMVFQYFIVAAKNLIEYILKPSKEAKRLVGIDINLKSIDIQQFRKLYSAVLSGFVFFFYTSNPYLKEDLVKAFLKLCDEKELAINLLQSLDNIDKEKIDFAYDEVWNKVKEITSFNKINIAHTLYYAKTANATYGIAVNNIKKEFNSVFNKAK